MANKLKVGDIVEYTMTRYDYDDSLYPVRSYGVVVIGYFNGSVVINNVWSVGVGDLYKGMPTAKKAKDIRKLSDEEIMLWKLESFAK